MSKEQRHEEEKTVEDPFAALFGDDIDEIVREPDPEEELKEGGDDGEDKAGSGETEESSSPPAAEPEPEEGPEAETLESREERAAALERENHALKKKMYALREKQRMRDEEERLRQIQESSEDEVDPEDIGEWGEDGKFKIDRERLAKHVRETAPPAGQFPTQETYEQMRETIVSEYDDDGRETAKAAATELEESYRWLDEQVVAFCKEENIDPRKIGGFAPLMSLLDETGIRDDFEAKYPGVPIGDLIMAPTSPDLMRKTLSRHVRRRTSIQPTDNSSEEEVHKEEEARPHRRPRPRPMSRKGSVRAKGESETLTDVDPAAIFDMDDEEYREYERRSMAKLERT